MNGILLVNKPRGLTSFAVVARLRGVAQQKRVGHTGTLDPDVDGMLVVAFGKATKLIDFLQQHDKTYRGEATLGFATETEDLSGEVIERQAVSEPLSTSQIDQQMQRMLGPSIQIPPMYSAVKVKGRRLYDYARAGETVERPQRPIEVYRLQRTDDVFAYDEETQTQRFTFEANVSKGTYIRTLITDLGRRLGYPATMSDLTRVSADGYDLEQAHDLAFYEQLSTDELATYLLPIETVLKELPRYELTDEEWFKVKNGAAVTLNDQQADRVSLFYQKQIKALYQKDDDGQYRLSIMLNNQ